MKSAPSNCIKVLYDIKIDKATVAWLLSNSEYKIFDQKIKDEIDNAILRYYGDE